MAKLPEQLGISKRNTRYNSVHLPFLQTIYMAFLKQRKSSCKTFTVISIGKQYPMTSNNLMNSPTRISLVMSLSDMTSNQMSDRSCRKTVIVEGERRYIRNRVGSYSKLAAGLTDDVCRDTEVADGRKRCL